MRIADARFAGGAPKGIPPKNPLARPSGRLHSAITGLRASGEKIEVPLRDWRDHIVRAVRARPTQHSRAFSPIPETSPEACAGDQLVRWNSVFETTVKAALPLYLLIALVAILAF
jgi:hypothetical protein